MAEAAGTAIGAVSLGLQVCEGLYKFYSTVKSRNQEIEDISTLIKTLESTLLSLGTVICRVQSLPSRSATAIASVESCIGSCENGIKELKEFLDSVQGEPKDGTRGKIQEAGRKLSFGFRRDEGAAIRQKVQTVTSIAGLALHALNLELGLGLGGDLASLSTAMIPRLELMETEIAGSSTAVIAAVETVREDASTGMALVSNDIKARLDALEVSMSSQHEQLHGELQTLAGNTTALSPISARFPKKPPVRWGVCGSVNTLTAPDLKYHGMGLAPCGCDLRERTRPLATRTLNLGVAVLSHEYREASRHVAGCPLYVQSKAQRLLAAQFPARVSSKLSVLVRAGLGWTTGAGVFSISPQLNFRMTVEWSPAVDEIERMFATDIGERPTGAEAIKAVTTAERRILRMFQQREASPHDRLPDGSNLLHAVLEQWYYLYGFKEDSVREQYTGQISQLVKTLVLAGVPVNEADFNQETPLDKFLNRHYPHNCTRSTDEQFQSEFIQAFSSPLSDLPRLNNADSSPLQTLKILRYSPILIHRLDLPPIAMAILSNSEDYLRSTIAKHPHLVLERTYGMTALHLSSWWPAGLSILLSSGATAHIDETCHDWFLGTATAIDFAIHFWCEEAIELLFDAGCLWNWFTVGAYETVPLSCVRTTARKLADRRRELMSLAESTLTGHQLATVRPQEGVLDSDAALVVRLLRGAGVDVPSPLVVPDTYAGIYLSGGLDITYYSTFFDHGFCNVNCRVSGHPMPIQVAGLSALREISSAKDDVLTPGLLLWLEEHGCLDIEPSDALLPGTNTPATGAHILALRMAERSAVAWPRWQAAYLPALTRDVTVSRAADGCRCWCSSTGCLPFMTVLKDMAACGTQANMFGLQDSGHGTRSWEVLSGGLVGELLRFLTFEALEMTHTCCSAFVEPSQRPCFSNREWPSQIYTLRQFQGSVEEIRVEEEELHQRLENLVSEFTVQFVESREIVGDFIWGYWRTRMGEECVYGRDEKEAVGGDLGVVLEEYETPTRLKAILGYDFTFEGDLPPKEGDED